MEKKSIATFLQINMVYVSRDDLQKKGEVLAVRTNIN